MQTSFMHPPFGFALFYLRSVAPIREYVDRVTKQKIAPVTTAQIYWGAIPFLIIQLIMVALVIAFPQMVMVYKDANTKPNNGTTEITIPTIDMPDDDLTSAFGGTSDKPLVDKGGKSREERAAEDITNQLRGK
jgi:Tripartite ATP-independent periplasmic transporter, DctM component